MTPPCRGTEATLPSIERQATPAYPKSLLGTLAPASSTSAPHDKAWISPYGLPVEDHSVSSALRTVGVPPLSDASLEELDRIAPSNSFPEGAVLFVEGQVPRGVYVLCHGRVKLITTNRDGKSIILRIAQPGDILGLQSLFAGRSHELSAETLQPSQLAYINCADLLRFLKEHPDACLHLALQLSRECQAAHDAIRSICLSHSVPEKLARLLLQWSAEVQPLPATIRLKISLTHEEIAQLIGTTRETVTRTLSELKRQHVLQWTGSTLLIRDRTAVEALAKLH